MSQTLDLDDLNDLNDDVVVEVDVKEALKSSIFIVQKAAAPKSGVEFRQSSNGTTSSSLATLYYVSRRRATSIWIWDKNLGGTHRQTDRAVYRVAPQLKNKN